MKPITVKELIASLKTLDPKSLVAISTDSEGNSFSLMADEGCISPDVFMEKQLGTQEKYFSIEEMGNDSDVVKDYFGKETKKDKLAKCIILWPTN